MKDQKVELFQIQNLLFHELKSECCTKNHMEEIGEY